ncbi:MAG TPA: HD domain-containing protein [Mycobacteriales bacterium]|nr:HD domain-containing protein [Mycobacteriales bacterium]
MAGAEWARAYAEARLRTLGRRWAHTVAVANRAEVAVAVLPEAERDVAVAAAYVHDIGYAEGIATTGFHHLDGARHLRELGEQRLANLVAYHSAGCWEGQIRGLADELTEFDEELSLTADVLTYCDVLTGPSGQPMELRARIDDVERRYGADHPVTQSLKMGLPVLASRIEGVDRRLAALASEIAPIRR